MLTKQQSPAPLDERLALAMARAQANANARRDPEWLHAGWPFLRAAVIEGARGLDRLDWKWWKREEGGDDAVADALAAIWRHGLSHLLAERRGDLVAVSRYLSWSSRHRAGPVRLGEGSRDPAILDRAARLELLVGLCAVGRFHLAVLADLLADHGVEWEGLARKHLGDSALAQFRLGRGVTETTPVTFADGRDDREHLWEVAAGRDPRDSDYCDRLAADLAQRLAAPQRFPVA